MRLPMKQLFTQTTLIIALALMCAACAEQTNLYSVTGTSSQAYLDGNTAYMKLMDGGSYRDIDSCTVLHGNFQMSGPLDSVMCVSLFMGDTYDINNRPILVVLEEGNVKVNIGYSSVKAEGTPLNERLYHFLAKRDSIGMMLIDPNLTRMELMIDGFSPDIIHKRMEEVMRNNKKYFDALDNLETKFVEENYDNVLGTTWFIHMCERALFNFDVPANPNIQKIYKKAPAEFRNNPNVRRCVMLLR